MSTTTGGSSVRSSALATETVFNMADERDVLALLRQVHLSTLPLDIKNYLRDLIFSTRFGDQVPIDTAMIATFKTHGFLVTTSAAAKAELMSGLAPAAPAATPRKPVALVIGFSRHAPQFANVKMSGGVAVPATPVVTVPASSTPDAAEVLPELAIPEVILDESVTAATPAAPVVPADEPINLAPASTEPEMPVIDAPISLPETPAVSPAPAPQPVPSESTVSPAPTISSAPAVAPEAAPAAASSSLPPADRIAAIKREVNGLVGNPVNLIDVNNEVGREYMNALLDAMKKTLGATPQQEIDRAMSRLERAFVSVKEALSQQGGTESAPLEAEPTVAATVTPPAPVADPVAPVSTPLPVVELEPVKVSEPEMPAVVEEAPVARRILSVSSLDDAASETARPLAPAPVASEASEAALPSRFNLANVLDEAHSEPAASPVPEPAPAPAAFSPVVPALEPVVVADTPAQSEVITSVAKEKQLKELMEARQAAEAASQAERVAAAANNPLMADDVESGLVQLLSEWKLFKSSGIFGTGPSGLEHPLYKKISQLTMAAVLAGRFEGATAEIKRSIADYMNGWRYEEGIIHEQGETFEHYLRRVIRHILDNQGAG